MTLYLISGLGVDGRLLQKLSFGPEVTIRHLDWIEPKKGETLPTYALRMAERIDQTEEHALAGVSFGGMIAIEIAKRYHPKAVILLSSSATRKELPLSFRLAGKLGLNKIVPPQLIKVITPFTYWLFDAKTKEEKHLLKEILLDTSPSFVYWAMNSIVHWENDEVPKNLFHIHGKKDKVLPIRYVKADVVIPTAGHLMVYSHAEETSAWIKKYLDEKEA
jgi:pimeloyl-ACP methyl ester carboxylesterase